MKYFKNVLLLAPTLCSFRNVCTVTTVVALMIPKSYCVDALPSGKKKDEDDNFFKKFTDKMPDQLKQDVQGFMGTGVGSLKSIFESGVPAQVS